MTNKIQSLSRVSEHDMENKIHFEEVNFLFKCSDEYMSFVETESTKLKMNLEDKIKGSASVSESIYGSRSKGQVKSNGEELVVRLGYLCFVQKWMKIWT